MATEARTPWVWLSAEAVDFGIRDPDEIDGERMVWLHADPFRVLRVRPSAGGGEVRRAYLRAARQHHPDLNPDDEASLDRFRDAQQALAVVEGTPELTVEPTAGEWWSFAGFEPPDPSADGTLAVAGIAFDVHDLHRVPLRGAEDSVRITYAGQTLPLTVRYGVERFPVPLWRARLAIAAEYSFLVLLCLAIVPVLAILLAADVYLLSETSAPLAWAAALLILVLGYGGLAVALATAGRSVPYPRRAVRRTRAFVTELRALGTRG